MIEIIREGDSIGTYPDGTLKESVATVDSIIKFCKDNLYLREGESLNYNLLQGDWNEALKLIIKELEYKEMLE